MTRPDVTLLVCSICKGARWVCAEHPLAPWHVGHIHCASFGVPCDACNPGPSLLAWSTNCLECTTPEQFCKANPTDPDVILAEMERQLPPETPMSDPRIDSIRAYFEAHATRVGCAPFAIAPERWEIDVSDDPLRLHKPYGWTPPRPPDYVMAYCPEMIAEQTEFLSDSQMDEYLTVLGFCISMHIQHNELPPEDRERIIDRTLYDIGPQAMELLNLVQMRVLDQKGPT